MRYLLYNPLAKGGNMQKHIIKIVKKYDKKGIEITPISVLDLENYNEELLKHVKETDEIEIIGGDGTVHQLIQKIDFSSLPCDVYMNRAGSGNDFARGHKGKTFNISSEIKDLPYFIANGKKYSFINGVGIGIDAEVCDEVNKNKKKESYYKTALRAFKKFKPYHLDIEIDGEKKSFDNVFFFVCMNGKYIGGGMKIAPHAVRGDDHLDLYVITAKNYHQLIRMFPLVFLGLHTILKKYVTFFKCKNVIVRTDSYDTLQTDGEVIHKVRELEIHRY